MDVDFFVDPGKRVYVNRITFHGHLQTDDVVFRRDMRLFEGAPFSPALLDRSKVRIQRLPFISSVTVRTPRVEGSDDLIDIRVEVEEGASGTFTAGAGYGTDGVSFRLGLVQENFLGKGNRLSFSFDNSQSFNQLSAEFSENFHTIDGISRTLQAHISETDATEISSTANYIADSYGMGIRFGVPITEYSTFRLGLNWKNTSITTTTDTSQEILDYLTEKGDQYDVGLLDLSFTYDGRDRTVFADSGSLQRVGMSLALPGSDLEYYKLDYRQEFYWQMSDVFTTLVKTRINYGDGYGDEQDLPFFERYYAGGVRTLRGYKNRSLGPRDSTNDAAGGDFRTLGNFELIFPPDLSDEKGETRISLFVDLGNVYTNSGSFESEELRGSYGIGLVWLSAVGPMSFSLAEAFRNESGDYLETFQFTLGSVF